MEVGSVPATTGGPIAGGDLPCTALLRCGTRGCAPSVTGGPRGWAGHTGGPPVPLCCLVHSRCLIGVSFIVIVCIRFLGLSPWPEDGSAVLSV